MHFLEVWDTVKSIGWLNLRARIEQARWPFTASVTNVGDARHAMALDERRHPYPVNRLEPKTVEAAPERYVEQWFAGVHSDVGGGYGDDALLGLASFHWMIGEAAQAGLLVDGAAYESVVGVRPDEPLPDDYVLAPAHTNPGSWRLLAGWRPRRVRPGDLVHPGVRRRIEASAGTAPPYRPRLPPPNG